jgi:arginase family enzyme
MIDSGQVMHIKPGSELANELRSVISGRPVYMHLDCDVLNPGIVPTEYVCPDGLSLQDLRDACTAISHSEVIGVEVAEFQKSWNPAGSPVSPASLIHAIEPVINSLNT